MTDGQSWGPNRTAAISVRKPAMQFLAIDLDRIGVGGATAGGWWSMGHYKERSFKLRAATHHYLIGLGKGNLSVARVIDVNYTSFPSLLIQWVDGGLDIG